MNAIKLGTVVSALFLSMSPALAAPAPTPAHPKPDAKTMKSTAHYAPGGALAAWSWRDANAEHIRLTVKDGDPASHFSGKVCGKGLIGVTPVGLEDGDTVALDANGKCATFDVKTDKGEDGFDIKLASKSDRISVRDFQLDGKPMSKTLVHTLDKAPDVR